MVVACDRRCNSSGTSLHLSEAVGDVHDGIVVGMGVEGMQRTRRRQEERRSRAQETGT